MKTLFLNLDSVSQGILVICFSISIVLLSASCLMLTVNKVIAGELSQYGPNIAGVGCDETYVYDYSQFGKLYKQEKIRAKLDK